MNRNILYIGNNFVTSTLPTLASLLSKEKFNLTTVSSKKNKFTRLLDMCKTLVLKRKKNDILLIDVYSTTNFYYALLLSQLARLFNLKYIPILHGGNLPNRLKKNSFFSKLIFKNALVNVSPSNYLKEIFVHKGFNVRLISNPIEINNYIFKERKQIEPKLLYVRAFAKIYNPSLAIKVLKEVQKKYAKAKLCMIGPDRDGTLNEVKSLIDTYNLNDAVEITGALSKEEWHKKSEEFDIFINTTNIDNTPVSVIEAMALGLPIISTNVGGIPFLIKNNKNGILVEKNNVAQMTDAIFNLIEKDTTSMILNARKTAESFAWENVKQEWFKILK